jgi:hypothetical protein
MTSLNIKKIRRYLKLWKPKNAYLYFLTKYFPLRYPKLSKKNAIKVLNKEWDYLIILDACRYDMFKLVVGKSDFIISGGSVTQEWLRWNFKGRGNYFDIVYIAGNPHLSNFNLTKTFGKNPFFKVIDVWDFGWDKDLKTVPPHKVTESALEAVKTYPNKRIIIHYNQPHHPFLGHKELLIYDDGSWHKINHKNWREKKTSIFEAAKSGIIPMKTLWKGYIKNLKIVMEDVYNLVEKLPGRTIITSDHGNHLGEYMLFGHVSHIRTKELVKVPWFTISFKNKHIRREEFEFLEDRDVYEGSIIKDKINELINKDLI